MLFLVAGAWNLVLGMAVAIAWVAHPLVLTPLLPLLTAAPYQAALVLGSSGLAFMALGLGRPRALLLFSVPGIVLSLAAGVRFVWPAEPLLDPWLVAGGWGDLSDPRQQAPITALVLTLGAFAPPLALLARRRRALLAVSAAVLGALALAALLGQFSGVWPVWPELAQAPLLIVLGVLAEMAALLHYGWAALGRRRFGFPLLVGLIGFTVSVVLSHAIALHQRAELVRDTEAAAQSAANEVSFQNSGLSEVRRLAHFWTVAGLPIPKRAQLMAQTIMRDFPGVRAINWMDLDSRVRWHVAAGRSKPAVGRVVRRVPGRRRAFEAALHGNRPSMTALVPLVSGGQGLIVFVPVGKPRIKGVLGVVFIPSTWFEALLAPAVAPGFHLDVTLDRALLFSRGAPDVRFRAEHAVSLLGQTLVVGASPEPATAALVMTDLPSVLLAAGTALSLLAAIALYAMQTARRHEAELTRLNTNLERVVVERTTVLEERTTHLEEERERWRVTLLSIGDGVIVTDAGGRVTLMNPQSESLTGWRLEEARGRPIDEVFALRQERSGAPVEGPVRAVLSGAAARTPRDDRVLRTRDGRERQVAESAAAIRGHDAALLGAVLVFRDISARRALEEEALKARGLESLGVLAGGIAHDFNNILTGVIGNLTLARHYGSGDAALHGVLDEAERSAWRARELTLQLLTFAKGGAPVKKVGSIADTVRDVCPFFLKGSKVRCDMVFDPDLWPVDFDSGQLSQVVHNLVVNAVEAMPLGGVLKVRGANVTLARNEVSGLEPGPYVELSFADTGTGIERQYLNRIFDPYFSLKPKGAGLGLAISYSIMKRHQGAVLVHSEPGCGATFRLYLPKADPVSEVTSTEERRMGVAEGTGEHVLLMEDDALVRSTTATLLSTLGYKVTEACNGQEAVSVYEAALALGQPFAAVVLDLTVLGGMGGIECLRALKERDPDVRAVVASGYYNDPVMAQATDYGFVASVAKPFHLEELAQALRVAAGGARAA